MCSVNVGTLSLFILMIDGSGASAERSRNHQDVGWIVARKGGGGGGRAGVR